MEPELQLFDADRTTPCPCPVGHCSAIRFPGVDKVITCAHDLEREPVASPKGCLNAYRPEFAEVPY